MKKSYFILCIISALLWGIGCSDPEEGAGDRKESVQGEVEIIVSAAASLTDALNEIKRSFEEEYQGISITYNFGSSGALQQQIIQGAPVNIFFSAAEDKFDELMEKGLIQKEDGVDLVGNDIVLVTPTDMEMIQSFADLPEQAQTLSIGTPESVPAGKYAKEMLENIGLWKEMEQQIVYAKDVRQVLTYVETGNVDAGIVYRTDALISSKVNIVATAEEGTHAQIIYPLGIIDESDNRNETRIFYEYLQSEKSLKILEEYGFRNLLE
ncbi:molybdate transport system substrate-binding protein [Evansella caseinilytica]|uniref:Molybdate transport system substrate-binding protein n=1 Tax=Evansella caseinilytica TaxID=1503961 RepID=A0A1H3GCR3_9BACI|nr:molybdate ABC transporter substrate-binding protein [Evansella caseinilytica]SDY00119.1 molybdate transport system substrate-binding protein [Evansella caseinilytica]